MTSTVLARHQNVLNLRRKTLQINKKLNTYMIKAKNRNIMKNTTTPIGPSIKTARNFEYLEYLEAQLNNFKRFVHILQAYTSNKCTWRK
jgi:hypothetical protein